MVRAGDTMRVDAKILGVSAVSDVIRREKLRLESKERNGNNRGRDLRRTATESGQAPFLKGPSEGSFDILDCLPNFSDHCLHLVIIHGGSEPDDPQGGRG